MGEIIEEELVNFDPANLDSFLRTDFTNNFNNLNESILLDLPEIDDNEQDFGLMEDNEDIVEYNSPVTNLSKEQLLQLTLNFSAKDIFVEKPYNRRFIKNNIHTFSKQNFMINRLNHMLPMSILYTISKYIKEDKYFTLNIFDYIHTLGYIIKKFNDIYVTKNKILMNSLLVCIYKFLTNTYIMASPDNKMFYTLTDGDINFSYLYPTVNESDVIIDKLINSKNYINKIKLDDYIYIEIQVTLSFIIKQYIKGNTLTILQILSNKYEQEFKKNTTIKIEELLEFLEY